MQSEPIHLKFKQLEQIQSVKKKKTIPNQDETSNPNRIINLVNKTRSKLKLINNTPDARFNKQLQQFRILETFIDTKARLKKMNILNNRDLLESVKGYLIRRKIARQLGQEETEIEKVHELFEVQFDSEFDKTFLDSDYFLNLGQVKVSQPKQQIIQTERYNKYNAKIAKQIPPLNLSFSKHNNFTKPQYDQNLFYQQIENQMIQQQQEKEAENIFSQFGRTPQIQPQIFSARAADKQIEKEKISQIDYDKELMKIALTYGIDLNSTEQLEEDIYKAFKQKAQEYIRKQISDAKQKHNHNIEEDNLRSQMSLKAKKKRVSSMFEQEFLNYPKYDYQQKSIYEFNSKKHTLSSENRKSLACQERLERKKEKTIMISKFNQQSKQIANMCNANSLKMQYHDFIKDMQVMHSYVDEAVQRTNFQRKLSSLGFSQEEQFLIKKQILLPGQSKKHPDCNVNILP